MAVFRSVFLGILPGLCVAAAVYLWVPGGGTVAFALAGLGALASGILLHRAVLAGSPRGAFWSAAIAVLTLGQAGALVLALLQG